MYEIWIIIQNNAVGVISKAGKKISPFFINLCRLIRRPTGNLYAVKSPPLAQGSATVKCLSWKSTIRVCFPNYMSTKQGQEPKRTKTKTFAFVEASAAWKEPFGMSLTWGVSLKHKPLEMGFLPVDSIVILGLKLTLLFGERRHHETWTNFAFG